MFYTISLFYVGSFFEGWFHRETGNDSWYIIHYFKGHCKLFVIFFNNIYIRAQKWVVSATAYSRNKETGKVSLPDGTSLQYSMDRQQPDGDWMKMEVSQTGGCLPLLLLESSWISASIPQFLSVYLYFFLRSSIFASVPPFPPPYLYFCLLTAVVVLWSLLMIWNPATRVRILSGG